MNWIDINIEVPNNLEIVLCSDGDWWYKAKYYKEDKYHLPAFVSHGKELKNITHWCNIKLPKKI